jgi:hypothetical protein
VIIAALLIVGCDAGLDSAGGDRESATDAAFPEGTIRVDVTPPAGDGTLLPQSFLVGPEGYGDGIQVASALAVTVEIHGVLTADVVQGWTPTSVGDGGAVPAVIRATRAGAVQSGAVHTDETGTFSLLMPGRQSYDLAIVPDDAAVAPMVLSPDFDVADGADLTQTMAPMAPVYGRVTDETGERIAGAQLALVDVESGQSSGTFSTDDSGWFVARAEPGRDYDLRSVGGPIAHGLVLPSVASAITVADETGGQFDLNLGPLDLVQLDARFVDAEGNAVEQPTVRVTSEALLGSEGELVREETISSDGTLSLALLAGEYTIEVWPAIDDVSLAPWVRHNVDLSGDVDLGEVALAGVSALSGAVVDEAANALVGATVNAKQVGFGGYTFTASTDDAGRFALDVPATSYDVTVTPATARQGALSTVRLDLRSGDQDERIELPTGTPVEGLVTSEGVGVPYALVSIVNPNTGALLARTLTDGDGFYSVRVALASVDEDATGGDTGSTDTGSDEEPTDSGNDTATGDTADSGADTADTADTGRR